MVHALPSHIVNRYAQLSHDEMFELAARWAQPNGRIRIPRSSILYVQLLRAVARLARITAEEKRTLFVRTRFRGCIPQ